MGEISRIQLFTCVYNPAERDKTMNEVSAPVAVRLKYRITLGQTLACPSSMEKAG